MKPGRKQSSLHPSHAERENSSSFSRLSILLASPLLFSIFDEEKKSIPIGDAIRITSYNGGEANRRGGGEYHIYITTQSRGYYWKRGNDGMVTTRKRCQHPVPSAEMYTFPNLINIIYFYISLPFAKGNGLGGGGGERKKNQDCRPKWLTSFDRRDAFGW